MIDLVLGIFIGYLILKGLSGWGEVGNATGNMAGKIARKAEEELSKKL